MLSDVINPTPIKYIIVIIKKRRLVRVREWLVDEGGAVLCSFVDWFLLLVAWLLGCLVSLSCLVCVSFISSSLWVEHFGAWIISLSF